MTKSRKDLITELVNSWNTAVNRLDFDALRNVRKLASVAARNPQHVNFSKLKEQTSDGSETSETLS